MAGVAIQNVKILHKRYTDAQWTANKNNDNYKLSLGEFGIAIDTGEVRGFIYGGTGDDAISWDEATPIGSLDLEVNNGTPEDKSYIYGIEEIRQDDDSTKPIIGYKLLKSTLPSLSVDESSADSDYAETVITGISIDDTDDHKIKYETSSIQPWTTDNNDSGLTSNEGTQVIRFIKDGSLSTTAHTHTLTRNYNEIKFVPKTTGLKVFEIDYNSEQNTYTVNFDDTLFGKTSNLAGAMTFKGIIKLTNDEVQNISTEGKISGDTYKIVASQGETTLTSTNENGDPVYFHLADGAVTTSASLNHGDTLVYTELDPDGDDLASAHWCVIPSGDEPSGTVTEIEVGDGLATDELDNKINSAGKIWHRAVADATSYTDYTGTITSVSNTAEEIYAFPKLIEVDNNHEDPNNRIELGHVNKVEWQTVKIFNEDTIDGKIYQAVPTFTNGETDKIRIEQEEGTEQIFNSTAIQQPTFKITHAPASSVTVGEASNTNKVSEIEYDETGHITKLVYEQDIDTQREIKVDTQQEFGGDVVTKTYGSGSAGTSAKTLTYKGSDNIKLSADDNGNITITTRGIATSDEYGFIKAGYSEDITETDAFDDSYNKISSTELAASNVSAYPVRVNNNDGTAWVRVPDHKYASNVGANKPQDMYAFSTDAYGHISQVSPITCIDGNPPIES